MKHQSPSLLKRPRQQMTRCAGNVTPTITVTSMLLMGCCLCFLTTTTTAYNSPLFSTASSKAVNFRKNNNNNNYEDLQHQQQILMAMKQSSLNWKSIMYGDSVHSDDHDAETDGWLSWMAGGKKKSSSRGSGEVKFREAAELGGLPRSDRYSSRDWLHNTISLPNSAILRDVSSPVGAITLWATALSFLHNHLLVARPAWASFVTLPSGPHSLMVSALSLLLVFKTNSAYQRFAEGRKIWEKIISTSRDLYRLMMLYEDSIGRAKRRRLQRLLAAFPYLLRHRIRPNKVMYRLDDAENVRDPEHSILLYQDPPANELDPETHAVASQEEKEGKSRRKTRPLYWVDKRTLPWRLLPPNALHECARAQNRPLWVCDRMSKELVMVPDKVVPSGPTFTNRERMTLINHVDKLSQCIGACERIHQTAVPLNYARHSLRALTLWLFTLPSALVSTCKFSTGPIMFLISWLMFGIYEIGYSIEDPFQGTLRLSVLCDTVRRDVLGDEIIRSTAFDVEFPEEAVSLDSSTTTSQNGSNSSSSDFVDDQLDYASSVFNNVADDDSTVKRPPINGLRPKETVLFRTPWGP